MVELVDAVDSKSTVRKNVLVRVRPGAPTTSMAAMLRKFLILVVTCLVLFASYMASGYFLYFVLPFRGGESFDSNKWRKADTMRCERGPMVNDLENHLPEMTRSEASRLLGQPLCSKGNISDYQIGPCHYFKNKYVSLRVYFENDRISKWHPYWQNTRTPVPSTTIPTWKEYGSKKKQFTPTREQLQTDWFQGVHGESYGINTDHELVIMNPQNGDLTYVKNFKNGIGGINLVDLAGCN